MAETKTKYNGSTEQPKGGGPGGPRGGFSKPKNLRATLLRMFGYLARRPVMLVAALISVVVSSIAGVAGTYALRPIINDLTDAVTAGQSVLPSLVPGIARLVGVYMLMALCTYVQSNLMAQLAQKGCNQMRKDLFNKLQELPLNYFDRHTHGELMSRFTNDSDNVQMALEQSMVQLLSSAITFVSTVVMMIYLNALLFLVTVVLLAVIIFLFKKLGGISRQYYRKQQSALGEVNGCIQENIEGLKVVKAFTHEEAMRTEFRELNENYRSAATTATVYSSIIMPINAQLTNVGYAITAAIGGALAIFAGFDVGGLVSFLTYSRHGPCRAHL